MDKITLNNGASNPGVAGFKGNTNQQLPVVDWLADLPETQKDTDLVEVQFKNTRKGYFLNSNHISIEKGDMVAVEANPGHDIGVVTLMGRLVLSQIKKNHINMERYEVRRVYRKVKPVDMEKYNEAKAREHDTMIRARQIANDMKLNMKIGDVEFQGDGSKAIFYYIADDRVDFRQLIKVFAEEFRVRIEMKQIGARQEAGRIGGIGPCGRELCCTTWMSNFVSVSTMAARYQDLSTNPLKLAGQCAKIKCCVNFEAPMYIEAQADFPAKEVTLETKDATYYFFKADVFKRLITYSSDQNIPANLQTISVERAKEIIAINKSGEKVDSLIKSSQEEVVNNDYQNVVGQDSLTRFDKSKNQKRKEKRKENRLKTDNEASQKQNNRDKVNNSQNKNTQNIANNQTELTANSVAVSQNNQNSQNNKNSQNNQSSQNNAQNSQPISATDNSAVEEKSAVNKEIIAENISDNKAGDKGRNKNDKNNHYHKRHKYHSKNNRQNNNEKGE